MRLNRATASSVATFCVIFIGSIDLEQFGASPSLNLVAKATSAIIAITLAILFMMFDRSIIIVGRNAASFLVATFGLLAIMSFGWSIDKSATATAITAWSVTFAAASLLLGLDRDRLGRALLAPFGIICALSLVYAAISPDAFSVTEGLLRLRGVVYGPHGLAEPSVLCLCMLASGIGGFRRVTAWLLFVAFAACLYFTYSRQAYVAVVAGVGLAIYLRMKGNARLGLVFGGLALVGAVLVFFVFPSDGDVTAMISRGGGDNVGTLTGRTLIWAAAVELIAAKPLLGYGFGAGGRAIEAGYSAGAWTTQSAHNAVLQTGLDLGGIGIALLILSVGLFVLNAFRIDRRFSIPLAVAVVTISLVERGLYETGGFVPLVFLIILTSRRSSYVDNAGGPRS